jgi:hypothetical protein
MKTFKVGVKLASGRTTDIQVQAQNYSSARELAEAQYGRGCVVRQPSEVR